MQLEKPHAGSIFRPLLAQITYHDFQPIKKDIWVNFKPSSQYNFMQKNRKVLRVDFAYGFKNLE